MRLESGNPPRRRGRARAIIVLLALVGLWIALALLRVGEPPAITIEAERAGIGRTDTPIEISISEPKRGLSEIQVELMQGNQTATLAELDLKPRPFWRFWGHRTADQLVQVAAGRSTLPELKEGEAVLRVTAARAGTPLKSPPPVVVETALPVRLTPPRLVPLSTQNYVAQGGSGAIVYRVGATALASGGRDGVRAGGQFFPGYPLSDNDPELRWALYGIPYDLEDSSDVRLEAADDLDNVAHAAFLDRFMPKPLRFDTIEINDRFLEAVVPEIMAQTPELDDRGDLLSNYLMINGELRAENAKTLTELAKESPPTPLWSGAFLQLPGSQVTSSFADRRTYVYDGREVDRQDHLGFDLASLRRAPVPAANHGVVVLARYFGIYGNTVVVDHGCGLMSLYSHLSALEVETGQTVERGQRVGRTGETGLAAGDHLHFTLLLGGLPINPIEWWDPAWVRDRVDLKLTKARVEQL